MNVSPRVSVIIPTYNYGRYISEAVESVLAQTYTDFEVIVVDDGSTDQTPQVLERYTGVIRYIRQENMGVVEARNRGIRESRGEFIAFLDADDKWISNKLALQVGAMDEKPEVGLVHANYFILNERGDLKERIRRYPRIPRSGWIFPYLLCANFVMTSSVMVRRICFDHLELFQNRWKNNSSDYEMWLRIATIRPFQYLAYPLVVYRVHGEGLTANEISWRNRRAIVNEFMSCYGDLAEVVKMRRTIWCTNALLDAHLAIKYGFITDGVGRLWGSLGYLPFSTAEWGFFLRGMKQLFLCTGRTMLGDRK